MHRPRRQIAGHESKAECRGRWDGVLFLSLANFSGLREKKRKDKRHTHRTRKGDRKRREQNSKAALFLVSPRPNHMAPRPDAKGRKERGLPHMPFLFFLVTNKQNRARMACWGFWFSFLRAGSSSFGHKEKDHGFFFWSSFCFWAKEHSRLSFGAAEKKRCNFLWSVVFLFPWVHGPPAHGPHPFFFFVCFMKWHASIPPRLRCALVGRPWPHGSHFPP